VNKQSKRLIFLPSMDQTEFVKDGYQLFSNVLNDDLLKQWRDITDEIEKKAMRLYSVGSSLDGACIVQDSVGPRLIRYDNLFFEYPEQLLKLLSIPPLLKIIKLIAGPTSVFTQCDLLIKHQHPHPVVRWHQDAPNNRNYPYLNIGIYLDDANEEDGCLCYLSGSQHELQPIEQIEEKYGWNPPCVQQQAAKAGDILVQDMMVLHGSGPRRSQGKRRTIYFEVRPYEAFLEEGRVNENWLALRKSWTAKVLALDKAKVYSAEEKEFFKDHLSTTQLIQMIKEEQSSPIPAVYGYGNTFAKGYPIPSDLETPLY
jgi:hypothetical protein